MAGRTYDIGIIPCDGIGKDVVEAAIIVLKAVNDCAKDFTLELKNMEMGEDAIKKYGDPFPQETLDGIKNTDAVLFGAAGGEHASTVVQGIRKLFDLYANVRPIKALPGVNALQPKADFVIIKENNEGLYKKEGYIKGDNYVNLRTFTKAGMERFFRYCFKYAVEEGRKKVTFANKAIILTYTDKPLMELFYKIAKDFPTIAAEDMEIDACAMQMIMKPERLDVVVAEGADGGILSDVGAGVIGGLGFAPGANIGDKMGVFEPIHGTAPKYAGKYVVNPIAAILAAKMMIKHLGESKIAEEIEKAIKDVLREGKIRTYDIGGNSSTLEVGDAIANRLRNNILSQQ